MVSLNIREGRTAVSSVSSTRAMGGLSKDDERFLAENEHQKNDSYVGLPF
jgi:hypothetical protein